MASAVIAVLALIPSRVSRTSLTSAPSQLVSPAAEATVTVRMHPGFTAAVEKQQIVSQATQHPQHEPPANTVFLPMPSLGGINNAQPSDALTNALSATPPLAVPDAAAAEAGAVEVETYNDPPPLPEHVAVT